MLIQNGLVWTGIDNSSISGLSLRIEGSKIKEVGRDLRPYPEEDTIDAQGFWILPGFIDAHTHVGLSELGTGRECNDTNESSNPVTPEMNGLDGINPFDKGFELALSSGVTTVMTGPGSANVIGGLFVGLRTWGKSVDQMQIPGVRAMKGALGENPKRVYGKNGKEPKTRMAIAALLRQALLSARYYEQKKKLAESRGEPFEVKVGQEALLPVLRGEIPLKIHAHRADDILTAIRIAKEFQIRITLDHCTEGFLVMEDICQTEYPVLCGPTLNSAQKVEVRLKGNETLIQLSKRNHLCCVITDHPEISLSLLPVCAGLAVRDGLSEAEALRSITINPAKILGLEEKAGTLEAGKWANLCLYSGNPLSNLSRCLLTLGEGKILYQNPGFCI